MLKELSKVCLSQYEAERKKLQEVTTPLSGTQSRDEHEIAQLFKHAELMMKYADQYV